MNASEIWIKIKTSLESKPIEEAKKKTEELGKTAQKAGQESSSGMNVMGAATALMTGNFNGAVAAIAPLIEKIKGFKGSMTILTALGGLVAALALLFKTLRDAADAAAQRLAGIKGDNLRNEITSTAEAYDKLKTSMDAATAKDDAILEHNQAMIDANKRLSLSINEISKQRELASAKDDDERRVIENKYKGKAEQISGMSDQEKENASLQRSVELENDINAKIQAAEERKREATAQAEKALQQSQNSSSTARSKIGYMSMYGGTKSFDTWSGISQKSGADADTAIKEFGEADADIEKLKAQRESVKRSREVAQKNRDASSRERIAASMATGREASDVQRDISNKAAKSALQSRLDLNEKAQTSAEERFKPMMESASRNKDVQNKEASEARKVAESYRQKGDRKGYAKALQEFSRENAEAQAASKALTELTIQATTTIKALKTQAENLQDQMKRIGS